MISTQKKASERACDGFEDENDACRSLDDFLDQFRDHFQVLKQQPLEPNGSRVGWTQGEHTVKTFRVDRLLIPKPTELMRHRWNLGIAAIEVKRSGRSLTDAATQIRDYVGSRWFTRDSGVVYTVSSGFVFPYDEPSGAALGLMNQDRLGVITPATAGGSVCARLGGAVCMSWKPGQPANINLCPLQFRSGSR